MIPDGRTPVVVVTGFLGSGKTTLVNQLVRKESDSLVIVNEFGEVPVDHALIESSVERQSRYRTAASAATCAATSRRR